MNNDTRASDGQGGTACHGATAAFEAANAAWARKDYSAARAACESILAAPAPAQVKGYAHLRAARCSLAEGNIDGARDAYARIRSNAEYPAVFRSEAEGCIQEIDRAAQGLPSRDPGASRVRVDDARPGVEFVVAPDGNDADPGTFDRPFATLARARQAARSLKAGGWPAGGVAVTLRPGVHAVAGTFALGAEDSGMPGAPVVYRAETKGTAVLYGGARLTGFTRVTDSEILDRLPAEARGQVFQCDLKAQGIDDYGQLRVRGFNMPPSPPTLELYFNGQPMTLARWPNEGFVGIKRLVEPGVTGIRPSVVAYESDRHARWTRAEDAWLFGYFRYLWADSTIKVAAIDPAAGTLTTAEAYSYGDGMDAGQGIIYYAFNLLEEIDTPGEWHLDRAAGVLYFWPPSDPSRATIEIGRLSEPMVALENASHVRIEGLVFDLARHTGLSVRDCTDCLIAGCVIRRFAGSGVTLSGGRHCGILGCDLHTLGRRGAEVIGGDRRTLEPGRHFVENCWIRDFGRIDRTYTPAIQLEGVGNRVAHNLLCDGPSSAMRVEGNDHLVEYNEVHSCVRESDDQGAIDVFLNPTYRGVVYRHNYFHHNGKTGREGAVHGQAAIRFDDAISGMLVYGNIFLRSANGNFGAIQFNSGRDNVIDNNLFVDCKQAISGGWHPGNGVWQMIREGTAPEDFHRDALYLSRYPGIASMMEAPGINHIWRNVFYRCGRVLTRDPGLFDLLENGVFTEGDPGFVDAARGDYALKPDAALFETICFNPIPVGEIGLYQDARRASWPVHTTPAVLPDWR
jgi:hypothetical protein